MTSCFTSVLADRRLRNRLWHADTLVDEINTRCRLANEVQLQKQEVDEINTRCRLANEVQVQKHELLRIVIRHTEASHQQEMILLSTINNSFYTAVTL